MFKQTVSAHLTIHGNLFSVKLGAGVHSYHPHQNTAPEGGETQQSDSIPTARLSPLGHNPLQALYGKFTWVRKFQKKSDP